MTRPVEFAQLLLQCLREQIDASAFPIPGDKICLRFGQEVNPSLGTQTDECCTGLAWVRVASVLPLADPDDPGVGNCPITSSRRLTLEMGTARCISQGTLQAPTTCDQWTEAALKMDSDHAAMEAAICCLASMASDLWSDPRIFPGEYTPTGPDGNCIGGTLLVTIDYDCGCSAA